MITEKMRNMVRELSYKDRLAFCAYIKQTMVKALGEYDWEHYVMLVHCAQQVYGRMLTESRDAENVWMRAFVADRLHRDKYSDCEIGTLMGKNHSSIFNYHTKIQAMKSMPEMYRAEYNRYNQFNKLLEDDVFERAIRDTEAV